jgi:membrane-associated phospholipid phosphatase
MQNNDKNIVINSNTVIFLQVIFIIIMSLIYVINKIFPSIELLFALSFLILIWKIEFQKLLKSLLPFFILLLTFQGLRDYADNLSKSQIHVVELINAEKLLFHGNIPAFYLQNNISKLPFLNSINILTNILYMSHFVIPLITAIIIWYKKPRFYWSFVTGLIILSYLGFSTYIFYPAAPPWWATKYGYLTDQPVTLSPYFYPDLVETEGPNPVAAFPSLHMAYPTFVALFTYYIFGKKSKLIFLLPISIGFSAVYLGHHYVIDLIGGIIYALFVFLGFCVFNNNFHIIINNISNNISHSN